MSREDGDPGHIRTPSLEILYGVALLAMGGLGESVISSTGMSGGALVGIVLMGVLALLGILMVYIGVRRFLWKREYERIMGHSPWA